MSQYHAMDVNPANDFSEDPARPDGQDPQPNPFLSSVPLDPAIGADGADAYDSNDYFEQQHAPIDSSSQMPMLPSAGPVSTWTHTGVGSPPLPVGYGRSFGTQAQVSPISSTGAEWGQPMTDVHYPYRPAGSADVQSPYPLEPQYAPSDPPTQMLTPSSDQVPFSPLANGFHIPLQRQYFDRSRNIQTQYSPNDSSRSEPMVAPPSGLVFTPPDSAGSPSDGQLSHQQLYAPFGVNDAGQNNPFPPTQSQSFNVSQDDMMGSLMMTGQPSVVSQQQGPVTFDPNDLPLDWHTSLVSPGPLSVASRNGGHPVNLPQRAKLGRPRWPLENNYQVTQQLRRDNIFPGDNYQLVESFVNKVSKVVEGLERSATVTQIAVTTDRLCREFKSHGYNLRTGSTAS